MQTNLPRTNEIVRKILEIESINENVRLYDIDGYQYRYHLPLQTNYSRTNLGLCINNFFISAYQSRNRYLRISGMRQCGKSTFAAQKIISRILGEERHSVMCIHKNHITISKQFELFKKIIATHNNISKRFKIKDERILCENDNEIIFTSQFIDSDGCVNTNGYKWEISSIWIDDANNLSSADFASIDLKLNYSKVKNYKQMILTFDICDIHHWLNKIKLYDCLNVNATYKNGFVDSKFPAQEIEVEDRTTTSLSNDNELPSWRNFCNLGNLETRIPAPTSLNHNELPSGTIIPVDIYPEYSGTILRNVNATLTGTSIDTSIGTSIGTSISTQVLGQERIAELEKEIQELQEKVNVLIKKIDSISNDGNLYIKRLL